ncbi:TonB-dependent receptor [Taibaiella koreensis]|uniref:TonB-dependent receptor n=1 Tax=Taibaiella koreensis TaxID=1268548 RepID=UPI0013C35C60|nr:TonB-dependent receptor [Taibaiella koreensis]
METCTLISSVIKYLKRQAPVSLLGLILILLHGAFARLNAQTPFPGGKYTLEGILTDSSNREAVGFATVTLYDTAHKQVAAEIADGEGHFRLRELSAGNYSLEATFLGYETLILKSLQLSTDTVHNLGHIVMKPEKQSLQAVTITATKALIQDKGDRMVYNAENDITNSGGAASDVLRKVPGVSVDPEGKVELRGSANIKVLINGKPSSIMARNLADALKMIPANTIKSIEIMTTPTARFDAEGAGGVINIITKKNLKGATGNVNLTGGNYEQALGGSFGLRNEKLEANLAFNLKREREKSEAGRERSVLQDGSLQNTLYQRESKDNTNTTGFAELSLSYTPDTLNTLGFSANIWGGVWPSNRNVYARLTDSLGRVMEEYNQATKFKNPYYNFEFNLSYNRKMKRPGQELAVLAQYSYVIDNYPYTTDQYNMAEQLIYRENNSNRSHNGEWTLQADYTHPIGKHVLEIGAKGIVRTASSDYRVESSQAGGDPTQLLPNPARTNIFDYTQEVGAAYASLKLNFGKDWMLVGGGRIEYTYVKGDFKSSSTAFDTRYTNWIPSIILSRKFGGMHTIKASYTQRILRPQVWSLNPFIDASDPKNQFTGNPSLKPELNHVVELAYNLTTKSGANISTTLYGRRLNNSIEEVATPLTDGAWLTRKVNIGNLTRYGISESVSLDITKQWSVNGDVNLEHVNFKSPDWQNSGWIFRTNINTTYRLPKDYSLQASGGWNTGWIWFQGRNYGWHYYIVGAKKEFWNKNASITLNIANPFETNLRVKVKEERPNSVAATYLDFPRPSFMLTFAWKFGQLSDGDGKKVKKVENDDRAR